jgi:coproporphyrinogen III oxidase-like Fe-S oxidoreductase
LLARGPGREVRLRVPGRHAADSGAGPPGAARDIRRRFDVLASSEITLEANPEDVTPEAARNWVAAGITRVSVGVQSFEDRELSAVGRRHDSARARGALETLVRTGLEISGDLILGLPEQTPGSFRSSLARLCESGVGHVSVYLLGAEKSKTIQEDRHIHPSRYMSDDAQADAWLEMGRRSREAAFRTTRFPTGRCRGGRAATT